MGTAVAGWELDRVNDVRRLVKMKQRIDREHERTMPEGWPREREGIYVGC
jgi:hypothetical protein